MSYAKPIYVLCSVIFISLLVATILVSRKKEGHHTTVITSVGGNSSAHHDSRVINVNAIPDQSYVDNEAMSSFEREQHSSNRNSKPLTSPPVVDSAHREHTTEPTIRPFVFGELCSENSKEVSELLQQRLASCEKKLVINGTLIECIQVIHILLY